jgi:hypothetical protein
VDEYNKLTALALVPSDNEIYLSVPSSYNAAISAYNTPSVLSMVKMLPAPLQMSALRVAVAPDDSIKLVAYGNASR